jgi:hypothetical protein
LEKNDFSFCNFSLENIFVIVDWRIFNVLGYPKKLQIVCIVSIQFLISEIWQVKDTAKFTASYHCPTIYFVSIPKD